MSKSTLIFMYRTAPQVSDWIITLCKTSLLWMSLKMLHSMCHPISFHSIR